MTSSNKALLSFLFFLGLCVSLSHARAEFPENRIYPPGYSEGTYAGSLAGKNQIALTFDDGPDTVLTPRLLDLLKKYHYKATFFLVGQRITDITKPIVMRALREGHLIGSHSLHHLDSNTMTESEFRADFHESIAKVRNLIDESGFKQNEVYFRFPYGSYGQTPGYHHFNVIREESEKMFGGNCINFAFWTMDPNDGWGDLSPDQLFTNVFSYFDGGQRTGIDDSSGVDKIIPGPAEVNGGGVLLMHDIQANSIAAFPRIFEELKRRKIKVVPLNKMKEFNFGNRECGSKFTP
jgi:peptidoglycan/xylan/chitin deacetylase (PgdA/CDA1 family)